MKNLLNKNKIIIGILILLILSGIIILGVIGFNKSAEYQAGTRIEVYIPQGYEKQDIINIAKENFSQNISFVKIEKLDQVAAIKLKTYTEEELDKFKTAISEKYEIKVDDLEVEEIKIPNTRISNVISPYILPVILVTIISCIYMIGRNFKNKDKWKIVLKMLMILAIVIGIYFSLVLIVRIPFGSYTMPIALMIYLVTLIILVNRNK